jgi:predicted unusual protein kinase regulating ubiquinone biosynthesis (AarF/ABC1/UbiB family)
VSTPPDRQDVAESPAPAIDRRRYRRVLGFFARAFLRVLWSDFALRLPILRVLRTEPIPRWTAIARRYRALAVDLGGVLIKLGQYLSTRVDILPIEVTRELSGLQDEVPAHDLAAITVQIEEDFGRPLGEIFVEFSAEALGAASLAQAHAARLTDGQPVVVKVLRPGIEVLVETDLKAIGRAIHWLKWWGFVRRRIDLDWVEEEFSTTTRRELDLRLEAANVERFAEMFRDDPEVLVPKVFWEVTARRTLTEENVAGIKMGDLEEMRRQGLETAVVARKLYQLYMEQIFTHHFVHADPHPGNLFVHPIKSSDGSPPGVQIAFVDFGMMAEIPPRLRAALRLFLIGLGGRDAAKVVQALRDGGYLLPGADLVQLEEAVESVFDRFWGLELGRFSRLVMQEMGPMWKEFGRLLLETPIQLQVDLMFTGRAIELLSGLVTSLDDDFNPWQEVAPFAERLAAEAAQKGWPLQAAQILERVQTLADLPFDLGRVAGLARRGRLTVRSSLAPDARKELQRLGNTADRLGTTVLAAAALVAGAILYGEFAPLGLGLMGTAVFLAVLGRLRG